MGYTERLQIFEREKCEEESLRCYSKKEKYGEAHGEFEGLING